LALGDGETLSVSGPVVDSMVNSISGSTPVASVDAPRTIEPSQPHTDSVSNDVISNGSGTVPASHGDAAQDSHTLPDSGNSTVDAGINAGIPGSFLPDEMVQSVFNDVVSGIVSSPAEMTNPSLGDVVAADPISAAEPATLLLVASTLTLSARRLRRRR